VSEALANTQGGVFIEDTPNNEIGGDASPAGTGSTSTTSA